MNQILSSSNLIVRLSDQFKDMMIQVIYNYPKVEPQVTIANLLSYMMSDRNVDYPTKRLMNRKSDELYGLSTQFKISSFGYLHQFEARFKTLNPSYLKEKSIEDVLLFVESILNRPLLDESSFIEAKTNLKASLLRLQDNPNIVGIRLAVSEMVDDEPLKVYSQGDLELLEKITLQDVIDFHQSLITLKPIILVSTDQKFDLEHFQTHLGQKESDFSKHVYRFKEKDLKVIEITKDIPQSTLTQIYSTQIDLASDDYYHLRILAMILGQLPSSLLFQEIREKRSLCYSISSSLMPSDGLLVIQTGIDANQYEPILPLIQEQIERLISGDFSNKLLSIAKRMYIQNMERLDEDRSAYFNVLTQHEIMGFKFDLEELKQKVKGISKADIQKVAKQLHMNSQSFIKGVKNA